MSKTPKDILNQAKTEKVEFFDIRFTDMLGRQHHFTMPTHEIDEVAFEDGLGFDGSSVRGWKSINESDMFVKLDPETAFIDPFSPNNKTMVILGDIHDPITGDPYNRDPRYILKKSLKYMETTGIGDTAFFGPEAEFFIFSSARFESGQSASYYFLDSPDAVWNMGKDEGPNLAYKIRNKEGYFPTPPMDKFQELRTEMLHILEEVGIQTEKHHHEVATAGQAEINFRFNTAVKMADQMTMYKYIVKNVAYRNGYTVTFMPKPLFGDNGSGMHTHQSIWKDGKNLFAGKGYGHMSEMAMHYIGGILKHLPAIVAFSNPTTNSYKRLVPGFEAPVSKVYSARNRSAAIRIPIAVSGDKARRIEFRTPDPSCNPYLAFAAMLMAGLDGIKNKIDPGEPADFNLYEMSEEQASKIEMIPTNLTKVLDALEEDNEFLQQGDVFDKDFLDAYIDYKRGEVATIVNGRPHPEEFVMYYDC